MSGRALGTSILMAIGIATSGAAAQGIYSCKDKSGRTLTSDRPIPECSDRAVRELSPSGMVKREIAAPLTVEQRRQKDIDDRARKDAEEAVREKRRRDSALLAAYSSEEKIEEARRRALADTQASLKASTERLADLGREKTGLDQEMEFYRKRSPPPLFKRKVDDNLAAIADEDAAIKARHQEIDRVNQRYDEELKRYRELTGARR